jgi:hypothetical protein
VVCYVLSFCRSHFYTMTMGLVVCSETLVPNYRSHYHSPSTEPHTSNCSKSTSENEATIFLVVTSCSSETARNFEGKFTLHLHGRRESQVTKQRGAGIKHSSSTIQTGMFLRNIFSHLKNHTTLYLSEQYSS